MKKIFSIFVFVLLLATPLALAQEEEFPDAGTTPDSALHGLDKAFERISLAFTFNKEKKAEKHLRYAEERLAELKVMIDKEKLEYSDELVEEYDNNLEEANEIAKTAKLLKEDKTKLTELVALATSKHLSVLDKVKEQVPEQAKESITKSKEASIKGNQESLKVLAAENPEKAAEIAMDVAEGRINKAKQSADEGNDEEAIEAVEEYEKYAQFGEEISAIAQQAGKEDSKVQEIVAQATSIHLTVLEDVLEKVPEQARASIQSAIQKSEAGKESAQKALEGRELPVPGKEEEVETPEVEILETGQGGRP